MNVGDILRKKGKGVASVPPDAPLLEAVHMMAERRIGTVLVVDTDGRIHGILSERDLVRIIARHGAEARNFAIGDLATKRVVTCGEQTSLEDVTTLMSNNKIRHLPVLHDGRPVAMISARDVLDAQKDSLVGIVERQKRAYRVLLRSKEQADQANRAKAEFLSRMGHELRTPLNAIIGCGELIERGAFGPHAAPEYTGFAHDVVGAGRHLLAIVNDILDMSLLETGERQARDDLLDIHDEVAAALAEIRAEGVRAQLALVDDLPPPPLTLVADGAMLRQMLANLLSNAIKFTPSGGTVTVGASSGPEEGLRLSVADSGIGIPADAIDAVTRPFAQADGALNRSHNGTGLGLALVDSMMALHDGSLEIRSAVDAGTTVTLCFPPSRLTLRDDTSAQKRSA